MNFSSPAYIAAIAADDAYSAELVKTYGKQSADARYDYSRNAATPQLAKLAAAKHSADEALWRESQAGR